MPPKTERFEMRLELQTLQRIDAWRRKLEDLPSRAEAIRRLVDIGLSSNQTRRSSARQLSTGAKRKAAELASREIDQLGNQAATDEERAQRKRRLIKGPREFRDVRGDQPKRKS
jgi:hypothetical protein